MRLVLDTNVLIAAFIARGVCSDLFAHCIARHQLVASDFILAELREHLAGKFKFAAEEVDEVIAFLRSTAEVFTPAGLEVPVCRDADDDMVLATAVAGSAKWIVTGDQDLLVLREFRGIRIIRPADFAEVESREA